MTPTDYALKLIKPFEGLRLEAYPDPGTGGDPFTIGYGATGPGIRKGVQWTQKQADDRLAEDVNRFLLGVAALVTVPLKPNQLGALASLAFNIGIGAFRSSTLLKKLNKGDYSGAAEEFTRWNRAGGRRLEGLVRRRAAERQMFLNNPASFENVIGGSSSTEESL